ncbi:MAG: L-threonylcarbamoyladenylate synthase [Candidatus Omnitrophica bacterium]|nr:L-threonylcarbamoyladenylate synthase [Candidatus Omnitrophota bacterium]
MSKTEVLKINKDFPEKEKIYKAAKIINSGGLVGFPTETVYGIACAYDNVKGQKRLYKLKKRAITKAFTIHIAHKSMIKAFGCVITKEAKEIIKEYWPGPVTIILKKKDKKGSIGFRMPSNKIALALIKAANTGVVAPSANISGERSPISAEDVIAQLEGDIDLLIDGGITEHRKDSTIVDLTKDKPVILREGAIKAKEIMKLIKEQRVKGK